MMIQTGTLQLSSSNPIATTVDDFSTFEHVPFDTPFPEGSKVVVVPMVQTFKGPDTPGIRIGKVNTRGFHIRMNELVGYLNESRKIYSDGLHNEETIGWIAFTVD